MRNRRSDVTIDEFGLKYDLGRSTGTEKDMMTVDVQEVASKDFGRKLGIKYPEKFSESVAGVGIGVIGIVVAVVVMMGFGR